MEEEKEEMCAIFSYTIDDIKRELFITLFNEYYRMKV